MIVTDNRGVVVKTSPDPFDKEDRLRFIQAFIKICMESSRSPVGRSISGGGNTPRYELKDNLATRVVAVMKRRSSSQVRSNESVVTETRILNALSLQALLQVGINGDCLEEVCSFACLSFFFFFSLSLSPIILLDYFLHIFLCVPCVTDNNTTIYQTTWYCCQLLPSFLATRSGSELYHNWLQYLQFIPEWSFNAQGFHPHQCCIAHKQVHALA